MKDRIQSTRQERGSTLIEFTLTLLPLLACLLLTINVAWVLFAWASVQEGVREGVRFAITCQPDASIRSVVQQYSFGFIQDASSNGPIQINYYAQSNPSQALTGQYSNSPGNIVKVTISGVTVTPMSPVWVSNSPFTVGASSADIVEANPNASSTPRGN